MNNFLFLCFVIPCVTAVQVNFYPENSFFLKSSGRPLKAQEDICGEDGCLHIIDKELQNQEYGPHVCTSHEDCRAKCFTNHNNQTCDGYTEKRVYNPDAPFPTTTTVYDGSPCEDDQDCREKCILDLACIGYTKYAYGIQSSHGGGDRLTQEECSLTSDLTIYNNPDPSGSDGYSWNIDTGGYSKVSNWGGHNVGRGWHVSMNNHGTGCHVLETYIDYGSGLGVVGKGLFYSASYDRNYREWYPTSYNYDWRKKYYHVRKYYYYRYGYAVTGNEYRDKVVENHMKDYNSGEYMYGSLQPAPAEDGIYKWPFLRDAGLGLPNEDKYDGQPCIDDDDCKEKCIQDSTCEGYSKYAFSTYSSSDYGAPEVSQAECSYSSSLKMYEPPSSMPPAWNVDTSSLTLLSNFGTDPYSYYDGYNNPSAALWQLLGCHYQIDEGVSPSYVQGVKWKLLVWQLPRTGSLAQFYEQTRYEGSHPNLRTYKRSYYGVRKYYYYRYGQASSNNVDFAVNNYRKVYETRPIHYFEKLRIEDEEYKCFFPSVSEFQQFNTQYFNFPYEAITDEQKPFGALLDISNFKAYYNVGSEEAFYSEVQCNETLICVCQVAENSGEQYVRLGSSQLTNQFYNNIDNANNAYVESHGKYAQRDSYIAHTYGSCNVNGIVYEYYTVEECRRLRGSFIDTHEQSHDLGRHLNYVIPSQIVAELGKPDNEVEYIHLMQPLLGPSSTNVAIHERSLSKIYDGDVPLLSYNEAVKECTDRCQRINDCSYATVSKVDNKCELFRKCERTDDVGSANTFAKLGWSMQSHTTDGNTRQNQFYTVYPEQYLCGNYLNGTILHKQIFQQENADDLFFGSSFKYLHQNINVWPSQSYIYHSNGVWRGVLPTSKRYLKFDSTIDVYAAHYSNQDDTVGPKYGFQQQFGICEYPLTRDECRSFATFNSLLVSNLFLSERGQIFYTSRVDDCQDGETVSETQCMEYRDFLNVDGDIVDTIIHPQGCSVMMDETGALPSVVIYNENTASDIRIGDESEGYRFHRICYGNENRLFPPGCFLQDGVIKYNDDSVSSTCSVEKTCYCSFSIPLLEIEGGVKEALTDSTCAEVCNATDTCNYVQHHDNLCYGLETCEISDEFTYEVIQNWTNYVPDASTVEVKTETISDEQFLDYCTQRCTNLGYAPNFLTVERGKLTTTASITFTDEGDPKDAQFVGYANSLRDCHYRVGDFNFFYEHSTFSCFSVLSGGLRATDRWQKQMKCYCMEDQCPLCTKNMPFTQSSWRQIIQRKLVDNTLDDSKVIGLDSHDNYFPLFPFYGKWDCDADVYTGITKDRCSEHTKNQQSMVFAYNSETETCLVYNHFIDNVKLELQEKLDFAQWCFKNDTLQSENSFGATYGTCSYDIQSVHTHLYEPCKISHSNLVTSTECLSWKTDNNVIFSFAVKEAETFTNLAEAVDVCTFYSNCKYIVKRTNPTIYELFEYKEYADDFQTGYENISSTWSEVVNCNGRRKCAVNTMYEATTGKPDPETTFTLCKGLTDDLQPSVDSTKPLGCISVNNNIMFNTETNHSIKSSEFTSNATLIECENYARQNGYEFTERAADYLEGSFYGAAKLPSKCFQHVDSNSVFYNHNTDNNIFCSSIILDSICLYKVQISKEHPVLCTAPSGERGGYDLTCGDVFEWREALNKDTEESCTEVTGNVWVANDQISTYNRLELCYNDACTASSTFIHRRYDDMLIEETLSVNIFRQPKQGTECIINVAKPNNVNCSLTAKCMKQHSYSYVIEGALENCYKGYQSQECVPASNAKSLLTIPSYAGFTCSTEKQVIFNTSTTLSDINILECQDACIYDSHCSLIMYNIGAKECVFGLPQKIEAGSHLTCSYDKQMADYRQLLPRSACPDMFTPHTNPAFDKFKTYLLGNIEYNTGAFECEDCPAGQQSFSTTAYTCAPNTQLIHYCVVNNLINSDTCALKDAAGTGERVTSLQDCKEFCDATGCTVLNFEKQGNSDDEGKCYLMTSQLKAKQVNDEGYLACQKVFTSRICKPCPTGRYKADEGNCKACRVGQFQDEVGQANCKACPPQTYQNQLGQSSCKDELSYFGELSNQKTIVPSDEIRYLPGTSCSLIGLTGENSYLSKEQCEEYATSRLLLFTEQFHYKLPSNCTILNDGKVSFNIPMLHERIFDQKNNVDFGIVRDEDECIRTALYDNQFIRFGERTTGKVTDNNVQVTSGPNTLTLNYAECKLYAETNNYDFLTDTSTTLTGGCWSLSGQEVHYNYERYQNVDCSLTYVCIQRQIQGVSLSDCEIFQKLDYSNYAFRVETDASKPPGCYVAISTQQVIYNFQADSVTSCTTNWKCVGVSYDSPPTENVYRYEISGSNDGSVSMEECKRLATIYSFAWGGDTYSASGNPKGCFRYSSTIYFNQGTTTIPCDSAHVCILKDPHQLGEPFDSETDVPGCGMGERIVKITDDSLNLQSISYRECEQYSYFDEEVTTTFAGSSNADTYGPAGCFLYNHPNNGPTYYYNTNFQSLKKCDDTDVVHCVQRQRRFIYNTNAQPTGQCSDGRVDVVEALNSDEKACVKSIPIGITTDPLPNVCSDTRKVQGCLANITCPEIPNFQGVTYLGMTENINHCIQVAGNSGFKLISFNTNDKKCFATAANTTDEEADNIRNQNGFELVTSINDAQAFIASVKTTDRMCGFGSAIGIANGPYQNNIISNVADSTHGATKKCDACQQFQIVTLTEACVSCEPGKHYSSVAGGVCFDCDVGYFREAAKPALRVFFNNDTKTDDVEGYDLEVIHPGINFFTYPGTFYSQFDIPYGSLSRNFRCFACVPGKFAFTQKSRECQRCPNGKYNNVWASSVSCTNCPAGQFINQDVQHTYIDMDGITLITDGGHYKKDSDPTPCTKCPIGFFTANPGSETCTPCSVGTYQDETGFTTCTACEVGRFTNNQASSICSSCAPGTYEDRLGSTECKACEAGKYQDEQNTAECKTCEGGQYQDLQQQTSCKKCSPGTYTFEDQQPYTYYIVCKECVAGKYQLIGGQSSCSDCGIGKFSTAVGAILEDTCEDCNAGYYENEEGSVECKKCTAGRYGTLIQRTALEQCKICGAGTYNPSTAQTSCTKCGTGKYLPQSTVSTDHDNANDCKSCPKGFYNSEEGQGTCQSCRGTGNNAGMGNPMTGAKSTSDCDICSVGKHNQRVYNFDGTEGTTVGDCQQFFDLGYETRYCAVNLESRSCLDKDGTSIRCVNGVWKAEAAVEYPRSCIDCGKGSYGDATGLHVCKQCGAASATIVGKYQDQRGQSTCKDTCVQSKPYALVVDGRFCREPPGRGCFAVKDCFTSVGADHCAGNGVDFVQQCQSVNVYTGIAEDLDGYDETIRTCDVCKLGESKEISKTQTRRSTESSAGGSDGS